MWTAPVVALRDGDKEELERRVRAHKSSQREVRRAQIVLMAADGVSNRQIAMAVGIDQIYVGVWRKRYVAEGLKGLDDLPRSGRPRRFGPAERLAVAAKATESVRRSTPSGATPPWRALWRRTGSPSPPAMSAGCSPVWTSNPIWSGAG